MARSYLEIENGQRSRVFDGEQGGAEEAILEKACSSATIQLPVKEPAAQRVWHAALRREEIGPLGIPSSRPAWRWQLLCTNDAHFEFRDSF
jgi:hypothetical protein